MSFDFESALKTVPASPGIYIMRDQRGTIFYVGKAKDLQKRLRQYYTGHDERAFVSLLDEILNKIDVILTSSEQEALILEASYIKKFRPRYNIVLKDDKDMLQLRIDLRDEWPRVDVVRKRAKDGAHYFGPYPNAATCRRSLSALNRYFMLRTCKDSYFKNRVRPCLQYEIRRCMAPCVLDVDRQAYLQRCREAMMFLSGKYSDLLELLEKKMLDASERLAFELAASYRDQILAIQAIGEEQKMVQKKRVNQDYVAVYHEGETIVLVVMMVRDGRLMHMEHYSTRSRHDSKIDVSLQILVHHYQRLMNFPRELIVEEFLLEQSDLLQSTLKVLGSSSVSIISPKRGTRLKLLQTAQTNAMHQLREAKQTSLASVLAGLQERLSLSRYPHRIECFDISNLQAGAIVASMTVFIEGVLDASRCRSFKLRDSLGQNDYLSIYEVVARRVKYLAKHSQEVELGQENGGDLALDEGISDEDEIEQQDLKKNTVPKDDAGRVHLRIDLESKKIDAISSFLEPPDLMLIDGGKGQLSSAYQAIKDAGMLGQFDLCSIAEGRVENLPQNLDPSHSPERIFFPHKEGATILSQDSAENLLLARIRDETHRRAIGFHRKKRDSEFMRSVLDDIPGVGAKRKSRLLKLYGSVREIAKQSIESLCKDAGLPLSVAQAVLDALSTD
ncbi:MAG: excinuclease ABC subunit UvrC [Bradymonadales bacterium]|jgi:excinuclease ABC subunit C